MLASNPKN
jgi:VHS domain